MRLTHILNLQRMPERLSHGDSNEDKAGTETDKDGDAMLMYHRIGTLQCVCFITKIN